MPTKTQRVLITGGAGYIGSHACTEFLDAGYDVIVLDNLSTGFEEALDTRVEFFKGSILDDKLLDQIFSKYKIDAIVHFAASLIVEESIRDPEFYYTNNLKGSLILFKKAIECKIDKFIFSSTAAVYGESQNEKLLDEADFCSPQNAYGKSKLFTEQALEDLSKACGIRFVILRYFNVAGATLCNGQRSKNSTHLIKIISEAATAKRETMKVFGQDYLTSDGTCVRDYIHVKDLALAHVKALEYIMNGGQSDIFNCGYGKGYSVLDVIHSMEKIIGRKVPYEIVARRAGDLPIVVSSNKKILQKLPWLPMFDSIDEICESSYKWELNRDKS